MKITILSPSFNLTGGQRVKAIYAQKLHDRGHEVTVVSTPPPRPTFRQLARSLVRRGTWPRLRPAAPSHFDGIGPECRVIERVRPIVDADVPDADVVIATWWETAEWAAGLSPRKGAKAYFIQHHEIWEPMPAARVEATWDLPFQKIVVADWLADIARDRHGDDQVCVVPNAVDLEQFHAPPRGKNAIPTVGMMYGLARFEGCDISLEAFRLASRRVPGLRLVAFGAQAAGRETMQAIEGAEYHLTPPQGELARLYARCDAWLFASRFEGFGLPILEAMACRTPVIGTPAGAAPALIGQGGGYLVRPEDPEDMAVAIERVAALPDDQWRAMSDLAYATATQYTWDDATDLFEATLSRAVEQSRAAAPTLPLSSGRT